MYDIDIINVGKKIKQYRMSKNLSTEDLGRAIGKTKSTIVRYEKGEIVIDLITAQEICNALNIDLNDICELTISSMDKSSIYSPFNNNLLYLYYISSHGIVISSLEIEQTKYINKVLMKNGLIDNTYKQEYTGVLESNYNVAFFCLTNAISNPGLDKFQIEIDLHSRKNEIYSGMFLGVSGNTHVPTARKCIITHQLITNKEQLNRLFSKLKFDRKELEEIYQTRYWDMKDRELEKYVTAL